MPDEPSAGLEHTERVSRVRKSCFVVVCAINKHDIHGLRVRKKIEGKGVSKQLGNLAGHFLFFELDTSLALRDNRCIGSIRCGSEGRAFVVWKIQCIDLA